jgi:hypothetical protein
LVAYQTYSALWVDGQLAQTWDKATRNTQTRTLTPLSNNAHNLGSTSLLWNSIYGTTIYGSTFSGATGSFSAGVATTNVSALNGSINFLSSSECNTNYLYTAYPKCAEYYFNNITTTNVYATYTGFTSIPVKAVGDTTWISAGTGFSNQQYFRLSTGMYMVQLSAVNYPLVGYTHHMGLSVSTSTGSLGTVSTGAYMEVYFIARARHQFTASVMVDCRVTQPKYVWPVILTSNIPQTADISQMAVKIYQIY